MHWMFRQIFEKSARFYRAWCRLVTILVYNNLLKYVGHSSVVYPFYLLRNPQFIKIGSRTQIRKGCRFEVVLHGQDWVPLLDIGNNVNIEQNVHIICHCHIVVEDEVSITGNCAIVDVTHPYKSIFYNRKMGDEIDKRHSTVHIGKGSFIGFGSIILPNVRIGRGCVIGAGSVVDRDIPDFSIAVGVPARVIRSITPDFSGNDPMAGVEM